MTPQTELFSPPGGVFSPPGVGVRRGNSSLRRGTSSRRGEGGGGTRFCQTSGGRDEVLPGRGGRGGSARNSPKGTHVLPEFLETLHSLLPFCLPFCFPVSFIFPAATFSFSLVPVQVTYNHLISWPLMPRWIQQRRILPRLR